jgi:ferredoxin
MLQCFFDSRSAASWYYPAVGLQFCKKRGCEMVPNIDYSLCQGCGGCAEAFPTLFEMRDEKAWVINTEKFDAEKFKGILTICPYYAISIEQDDPS